MAMFVIHLFKEHISILLKDGFLCSHIQERSYQSEVKLSAYLLTLTKAHNTIATSTRELGSIITPCLI